MKDCEVRQQSQVMAAQTPETILSADLYATPHDGSTGPRRRLPVPHHMVSAFNRLDQPSSLKQPSAHLTLKDRDDNGNIKIFVEMEKQVKETVVGYIPPPEERVVESNCDNHETHAGVRTENSNASTADNRTGTCRLPVSAVKSNKLVGPLVSAWNNQQKSNAASRSARSPQDSTKKHATVRQIPNNSSTAPKRPAAGIQRGSNSAGNVSNSLLASTSRIGSSSTTGANRLTTGDTGRSTVTSKAVKGSLEVATIANPGSESPRRVQSAYQAKFIGLSSRATSRMLPPTAVSRIPPGSSKVSASESARNSSTDVDSVTSKSAIAKSGNFSETGKARETRTSFDRRSLTVVAEGHSLLTPRKLSLGPDLKYGIPTTMSVVKSSSSLIPDTKKRELKNSALTAAGSASTGRLTRGHVPASESVVRPSLATRRLSVPSSSSKLDASLKLQLSRCTSPSIGSQSSIVSEKSSRSSVVTTGSVKGTPRSDQKQGCQTVREERAVRPVRPHIPTSSRTWAQSAVRVTAITQRKTVAVQTDDNQMPQATVVQVPDSSSSSLEQLSVQCAHQPDLVTNTICHDQLSTAKLQQLEKCLSMLEKQLSAARAQLHHRTRGFEAMIVLVKRLSEESCPATVSCLNAELDSLRNSLVATSAKCDILVQQRNALIAEIQSIKEEHDIEVNALQVTHEMALQSLAERSESKLEMCLADAEKKRTEEITALTAANERLVTELNKSHQQALADKEQEVTSRLIDLEFTHKRKLAEVQRKHESQVKDLEQTKAALMAKMELLKADSDRMRRMTSSTHSLSSVSDVDADAKLQSPTSAMMSTLTQEIDSLKTVVDLRNAEVAKLKAANAELEKQGHELSAARDQIRKLQQKLENAEAIVSMKSDYERDLAEKHKALLRMYEQESKESKRLSMDKEQLMWRLNNDGAAPPPTTPNVVRRTISTPTPTKSAPGTPLVSRRFGKNDKAALPRGQRPFSQGDFDRFGPEDFVRDDPDDIEF